MTWRVKGELVMNVDDYLAGKKWDDSVCFACYQVDLHKPLWKDFVRRGVPNGVLPTIPLRAMIPAGIDHLTVAGAVASLAARHGTTPRKVDLAELKTLLKQHEAIVPQGIAMRRRRAMERFRTSARIGRGVCDIHQLDYTRNPMIGAVDTKGL